MMKTGVLAKYKDFLPVTPETPLFSLGEGDTPLVRCGELEKKIGCGSYILSWRDVILLAHLKTGGW